MRPIYLDHSATTPVRPEVAEAMAPYFSEHFGNAGSIHAAGRRARKAVDDAREQVAALIGADPREIIFTSGGTEADNLAIRGFFEAAPGKNQIIVSAVEHHAVLCPAEALRDRAGAELFIAPVDGEGRVDPDGVTERITEKTAIVSIMHVNNETGAIQPIETIAAACAKKGIPFHTDAVQSAGKIPVNVKKVPVTALSLSAHKLCGPKGIGALYLRRGATLVPQSLGGSQERERRAGTENVPGIVGFGVACELARRELEAEARRLTELRDRLEAGILARVPKAYLNGPKDLRAPHILNMGFRGLESEALLFALDMEGVQASSGSACTAGSVDPSHVLLAMGRSHEESLSAVRFSLGRNTTEWDIDETIEILTVILGRLRAV